MQEALNKLMKKFIEDCKEHDNGLGNHFGVKPTFENFIAWLDDRTWNME